MNNFIMRLGIAFLGAILVSIGVIIVFTGATWLGIIAMEYLTKIANNNPQVSFLVSLVLLLALMLTPMVYHWLNPPLSSTESALQKEIQVLARTDKQD